MDNVLEVKGITKYFGGVQAAKDVSFGLQRGKIYGLIGPNGAGKSTMMNIISGITTPDTGTIYLKGEDISSVPSHMRPRMGLGRTFQSPRFLRRASIHDNMLIGTDLAEGKNSLQSFFLPESKAFLSELEELMQYAGFEIDLKKDISSLTYGQMKILEIIRTLLSHPVAMLVDEPAAGLISQEQENVIKLVRYAAEKRNIAVLLIEHSMDLVRNVCEHIIVLNFGEVIAEGNFAEISSNDDVIEAYLGRNIVD